MIRRTRSKITTVVVRPWFIICLALFMIASAALSGWALTTAWNAKSREITVARAEAAHAVQKAQQAQTQNAAANAKEREVSRQLVCRLVQINASKTPPPTTARGFAIADAWAEFGKIPQLHCETK